MRLFELLEIIVIISEVTLDSHAVAHIARGSKEVYLQDCRNVKDVMVSYGFSSEEWKGVAKVKTLTELASAKMS